MALWPFASIARLRSRRTRIALSAHGTDVSFPLRRGAIARLYELYLKIGARLLPTAVVIANSMASAHRLRARLTKLRGRSGSFEQPSDPDQNACADESDDQIADPPA